MEPTIQLKPGKKMVRKLRFYAYISTGIIMTIGCLSLLGWILNISFLKSFVPSLTPMNPFTSIGFFLISLALLSQLLKIHNSRFDSLLLFFTYFFGGFTALLGLITVVGFLMGVNLGVDQLLFTDKLDGNRIAPNTGLNFLLVGLAILTLDVQKEKTYRLPQFFIITAFVISIFAIIGYAYSVLSLYKVSIYIPMAFNTALAFTLSCFALLFLKPESGILKYFTTDTITGVFARRFLIISLFLPPILGYFRLIGQQAGIFGTEMGVSILVISLIIISITILWVHVRMLAKLEIQRFILLDELKKRSIKLEDSSTQLKEQLEEVQKAKNELADIMRLPEVLRKNS
jgi:hypothetical protein